MRISERSSTPWRTGGFPTSPPSTSLPNRRRSSDGTTRSLDIGRSLVGGDARLLTLVGPGGAGKTRLSIEVAAGLGEHYPDGIWFVGLSSLQDPELIASTIATTLGLHEGFGSSLEETLQRFLRGRRVLLVIDNVEHLLPDAASVLNDVLAGAPDVQMLVSSREPLGLRSERVYPVRELPVADAVVLFRERARAAAPGFDPDERAASSIEAICSRLEGLPLAIELAAARVKVLTPTELFDRLNERLPLLTGGGRDAPERQRTMRAAIAWSYDLLDEDERRLFAGLGVFRGGCTLDAAERVCDAELDALASLVDKSLLRTEERPPGTTRYLSLETIREFAAELLRAEGGWEPISMRHAEYFRSQAELAYADLRGPHPATWIDRVEPELGNFRAAVRSSLDQGRVAFALRLMAALMASLQPCGHVQEARAAGLDEVLARSGDVRTPERGQVLAAAGILHLFLGELASSRSLLEEAVELAREVGDRRTLALAMGRLGWARAAQGLHDEHTFALGEEAVGDARGPRGPLAPRGDAQRALVRVRGAGAFAAGGHRGRGEPGPASFDRGSAGGRRLPPQPRLAGHARRGVPGGRRSTSRRPWSWPAPSPCART